MTREEAETKRMSKEEIIDTLKGLVFGTFDRTTGKEREAIDMAIEALKAQEWIPCNERMPEVSDYYLIQHSRHICQDEMAVAFYSVEEAELDKNYTWEFKPFADCKEVIAWMPLPEPYKAESEE